MKIRRTTYLFSACLLAITIAVAARPATASNSDPDFRYELIQSLRVVGDEIVELTPRLSSLIYRYEGFLAQRLLDSGVVNKSQYQMLSESFVHAAIGMAIAGEESDAARAIEKAMALGFRDLEDIRSNEYLAQYPSISEVALKPVVVPAPKETATYRWARESVEAFTSFPFTFDVENSNGGDLKLEQFAGKIVLVDIWATWCGPCRTAIPNLVKLQDQYGERGFQVVGLSVDNLQQPGQARETVNSVLRSLNANYPSGLAGMEIPDQIKGDQSIPMLIFLDEAGKVRFALHGNHSYEQLAAVTEYLLYQQALNTSSVY